MKSYIYIAIILLLSFKQSFSQQNNYAKEILDTICSKEYHGRGYGFAADKKTANYIVSELKKYNVKKFNKSYFQEYALSTNTFCNNNYVAINQKELKVGIDFLISSFSSSISQKLKVKILNAEIIKDSSKFSNFIKQDFSEVALFIDTIGLNNKSFLDAYIYICQRNYLKAKAVIKVEDGNLTFVPSQIKQNFTLINIKREALPEKIKTINLNIKSKFLKDYKTQNIIAFIKGKSDTSIVLSAHYDHIGHMGKSTYFPGANDNGSGVAMLLNLAKHFHDINEQAKYNIVFMFFSGEELGLLGSKYYTENPIFPLSKIKFLLNLDMVGSGDKGIKVVNGSVFKTEFNKLSQINNKHNYLPFVKIRGAAANSDHYFFYEKGVKSFFIYTLGEYKEYHNIFDTPNNLPLNKFNELKHLLIDFINSF